MNDDKGIIPRLSPETLRLTEKRFEEFLNHPQRSRLPLAFEKKRNLQEASRRAHHLLVLAKAAQAEQDRCEIELAQEPALELLHTTADRVRLFSRKQARIEMDQRLQAQQDQSPYAIALEMAVPSFKSSDRQIEQCCVCLYPLDDIVRIVKTLKCRHTIHADCWSKLVLKEESTCPLCRGPMI